MKFTVRDIDEKPQPKAQVQPKMPALHAKTVVQPKEVARLPQTLVVVVQDWEESERGWGVHDDGCSIHLTKEDLEQFCKLYWDGMKARSATAPDEYSRESGRPYAAEVTDPKLIAELLEHRSRRFWRMPEGVKRIV